LTSLRVYQKRALDNEEQQEYNNMLNKANRQTKQLPKFEIPPIAAAEIAFEEVADTIWGVKNKDLLIHYHMRLFQLGKYRRVKKEIKTFFD
jgi:hypothetical protein